MKLRLSSRVCDGEDLEDGPLEFKNCSGEDIIVSQIVIRACCKRGGDYCF